MICSRCGKPIIPSGNTGGYGKDNQGHVFCFACCGELDREELESKDRALLYLRHENITNNSGVTRSVWSVGNWPGTLKIPAVVGLSHGRVGQYTFPRRDVWFIGPDGDHWYGRNQGDNDLVYCRRLKHKQAWLDQT